MEVVFLRRKIYAEMLRWKESRAGSTALLIQGARRVGKSTIAKYFGQHEYRSCITIDFTVAPVEIKDLFNTSIHNLDYLFLRLQALYRTELFERQSLIIFDEVQDFPPARQAIKHLVADGRYDFLETGSLLSIKKNTQGILIPSEETRISMFPLDFEEFLWATNNNPTVKLITTSLQQQKSLGVGFHRETLRKFRLYMLIGGMPQAILTYLQTNNLLAVDNCKREIISLYLEDLRKIDRSGMATRILRTLPGELAKGKLRYRLSELFDIRSAAQKYALWEDLEDSQMFNFCYRCTDPNVGLALHQDPDFFKIYLGDTGLFVTLAFWDNNTSENVLYHKLLSDKLQADLGYVYENVAAQCLRSAGKRLFYYVFPTDQTKKTFYEVDFIFTRGTKLCPIEIKSSNNLAHKSLEEFCKKFSNRILQPYILSNKDLKRQEGTDYLPIYMAPFL